MPYLKFLPLFILTIFIGDLQAQSAEYDTLTYQRKNIYNTVGFQSKEVSVYWDGKTDIKDGELQGYGELEIRGRIEPGKYAGKILGTAKGTFKDGFIHGYAEVKVTKLHEDGTYRNDFLKGIFEKGKLINYDEIYQVMDDYLKEENYQEYFQTSEMRNFKYRIFQVEVTSAPFCEALIMGFKAAATISFESKDKLYDFTLRLRKENLFEPLQYKYSGNDKFTSSIITRKGMQATREFIHEKNMEALGLKDPPEKLGIDQYKNMFGYWIQDLPDSILDIAREQIYAAARIHNLKYNNTGVKDGKLRGVFHCEYTNQIFYFDEDGLNMYVAGLGHDALTKTNRYDWNKMALTHGTEKDDYNFETFEGGKNFSVTKKYQVLKWPQKENNYAALIKNGQYEYPLQLLK